MSSAEKTTHTMDAQTEKKSNQNVLIAKGHMLLTTKGVQLIKKQVFHQHVVENQESYASILKQNSALPPQPKGDTFSFKICSHCGHPNRSATGVLRYATQIPQKTQLTKSQVCVDEFPKQLEVN